MSYSLDIIIPIFNEASTVETLFSVIEKIFCHDSSVRVIVIDDGSTDSTPLIISDHMIKHPEWISVRHPNNRGKGAAIRTALTKVTGCAVVIQDADLEYDPKDILRMRNAFNGKNAVFGSRILGKNKYFYQTYYAGGKLLTWFGNILYGASITDMLTGYKLLSADMIKKLDLECEGFAIDTEITAKLHRIGAEIVEVPISYHPRTKEQGKKIRPQHAVSIISALIRHLWWTPEGS